MQGRGPNPDPTAADWWREHQQTFNGIISDYRTTWDQGNPGANLQARVQSYVQSFVNTEQIAIFQEVADPHASVPLQGAQGEPHE